MSPFSSLHASIQSSHAPFRAAPPSCPCNVLPLKPCPSCESGLSIERSPITCSPPHHSEPLFFQASPTPAPLHPLPYVEGLLPSYGNGSPFSAYLFSAYLTVCKAQLVFIRFFSQQHKKVTAALLHHSHQPRAEAAASTFGIHPTVMFLWLFLVAFFFIISV